MNYTITVSGDQTFVNDTAGRPVGLVQPDEDGGHGWTSWLPCNASEADAGWGKFNGHHVTREQALAAVGYRKGVDR